MNETAKIKANELEDAGDMSALYEFIRPYLKKKDPFALYLYSRFSLSEWKESVDEFDNRALECLQKAAEGGVTEAMYQLSSLYFTGEIVPEDQVLGKRYLDASLAKNFGLAKYSVSLRHFYGVDGYEKNKNKALDLMNEAAQENVDGAIEMLEMMRSSN